MGNPKWPTDDFFPWAKLEETMGGIDHPSLRDLGWALLDLRRGCNLTFVDLNERVSALEKSPSIHRDRIQRAAVDNERKGYDELQARVDEFVAWAKKNLPDETVFGSTLVDEVLAKLRELGLVKDEG